MNSFLGLSTLVATSIFALITQISFVQPDVSSKAIPQVAENVEQLCWKDERDRVHHFQCEVHLIGDADLSMWMQYFTEQMSHIEILYVIHPVKISRFWQAKANREREDVA
ncbi:MAG: hypothetical protein NW220_22815 [Leptolyngbyaceae cyanobacterium bins.349]|nr:hypothetical protein [Leptolyngbyaceae cyanobacterium bins.349]